METMDPIEANFQAPLPPTSEDLAVALDALGSGVMAIQKYLSNFLDRLIG